MGGHFSYFPKTKGQMTRGQMICKVCVCGIKGTLIKIYQDIDGFIYVYMVI